MGATLNEKAMYPISTKRGYGLSNGADWVIAPKYESLHSFYSGYAYAETTNRTKILIDTSGNETDLVELIRTVCTPVSIEFTNPMNSTCGPGCLVVRTLKEYLVLSLDTNLGLQVIETFGLSCELSPYYGVDWLFIRVKESGNYRTILFHQDQGMQSLKGISFVDAPYFGCEFLAITEEVENSGWAYYDIAKREIVCERYHLAQSFSDGVGLIQRECSANFEFLDRGFKTVSNLEFEWADVFRHGLAAGLKDGVAGYFDVEGACQFENNGDLFRFNRLGHAFIEYDSNLFGIFDINGVALMRNLDSCDFFDGDFPFYQVQQNGKDLILTGSLQPVSSGRT